MKKIVFVAVLSLAMPSSLAKQSTPAKWSRRWGMSSSSRDCVKELRGGSQGTLHRPDKATSSLLVEQVIEAENNTEAVKPTSTSTLHDNIPSSNPYVFSLYQPGDGHEEDPDNIPHRFLSMQKDDRDTAKASLQATLDWRQENKVDSLLARPHPNYDICKAITLHSFLGRDTTGHVVFFQRPAIDSGEHLTLAQKNVLNNNDLLLHYVYVLEYCWNVLDPPVPGTDHRVMTSIVDLTGLEFSILRHRELVGLVKQFLSMMSTHYPHRSYKTLILNAPSWFGMLYKLLSPLLRESTKEKVQILTHGKHQVDVLREVLGEDCLNYLPPDILETDRKKHKELLKQSHHKLELPKSPIEKEFREFCCARLQEAGEEMNTLIT